MSDDKCKPGRPDRDGIRLEQDYEAGDWSASLGITEQDLPHALQIVGNNAVTVREYLRSRKGRSHE